MAREEWSLVKEAEEKAENELNASKKAILVADEQAKQEMRAFAKKLDKEIGDKEKMYEHEANEKGKKEVLRLENEKQQEIQNLNIKKEKNMDEVLSSILKAVRE